MHRETLSRSLYFSHSLMGKSIARLGSSSPRRGIAAIGAPSSNGAIFIKGPLDVRSFRCYHTSLELRNAQSLSKTVVADTKQSSLEGGGENENNGRRKSSSSEVGIQKQFNIRAKDILSVPEDTSAPRRTPASASVLPNGSVTTRSLLDNRIFAARSMEELLNLSAEPDMTLKHACLIIFRLGNFSHSRAEKSTMLTIQTDKRFVRIFNLIQRGNHSQFPHALLQALNGLQKLGLETSAEVSGLLEQELSWSMRRCPLRFLAKSVRILHNNKLAESTNNSASASTDDNSVLEAAIKVLHRRWIEAYSGSDFISLIQIIDLLDDDTKLKVEDRAADVAHQFSPVEMMKIFVVLGSKKRRPTPLLRALAFHYSKSEHKSSSKDIIEFIYALNELTFADPILMNRLCSDLSEEISHVKNVALISSLMTSLGQMRYKHKEIIRAVDEWIIKHLDDLRPFDVAAWLQAAATFNHESENVQPFCRKAQQVLTQSTVSSPTDWVNVVHSFVILNVVNNDMLSTVLAPDFVGSIERLGSKASKQKAKLLNLNYLASRRRGKGGYSGPLLEEGKVKQWVATLESSDSKLSKLMTESLGNFLPATKYLVGNQPLDCGVFVDAQCYIDSKLTPMTLDAAKQCGPGKAQQVAILVEGYPAMCLGLKTPTGNSVLNANILKSQNFAVITIPYTEFAYNDKLVRRVQYLEQKLKGVSQNSSSSSSDSSLSGSPPSN